MNRALKKRTETALDELARTYDLVRELLVQRLEEIDTRKVRKQMAGRLNGADMMLLRGRGYLYAGALRKGLERRVRPKPKRRRAPFVGLAALGAGLATAGWLLYDRSRREAMRQRLTTAQSRARERYTSLGGVGGALGKVTGRSNGGWQEPSLRSRVEAAIAEGGTPPAGLEVSVEGRTVYLRGSVEDPAFVDAAAERIHGVDGVVAVVNLTTGPTTAGASTNRA